MSPMRVELNEAHQREHVPWDGDQLWPMIKSGDTLCFVWKSSGRSYCLTVDTIDLDSSEITLKMHNNTRWELKVNVSDRSDTSHTSYTSPV